MPNREQQGLSTDQLDTEQQALWERLGELPQHQPSDQLRRQFYDQLANSKRQSGWQQLVSNLRGWFQQPLVPAALSLALGLWLGGQYLGSPTTDGSERLDALQAQVTSLNTTLALNLMQNAAIGDRLSGIELASGLAASSAELDQALLARVQNDDSQSVRSAALAALGPRIGRDEVWQPLQRLLTQADSPLVQLALADQILRWGQAEQLEHLQTVANGSQLHPDIKSYVLDRLQIPNQAPETANGETI